MRLVTWLVVLLVIGTSCNKEESPVTDPTTPYIPLSDKIINKEDGTMWLYGGPNESDHFDITDNSINLARLKYGIGRELFNTLKNPEFVSIADLSVSLADTSELIVIHADEGIFAYPFDLMVKHEVINDVIDGVPVLVSYCVLADFIGVFSREYCKQTLMFGVSGYTYYSNGVYDGKDGFVLWDRDTESLWWPLINTGVSGTLKDAHLSSDLPFTWERTTMEVVNTNYPTAQILKFGQFEDPPTDWTRLEEGDFDCD